MSVYTRGDKRRDSYNKSSRSSTFVEISMAYKTIINLLLKADRSKLNICSNITTAYKYILVSSMDQTADYVVKAIYSNILMIFTDAAHTPKPQSTTKCINVCRSILSLKQLYYFLLTPVGNLCFSSHGGQRSESGNNTYSLPLKHFFHIPQTQW